MKYMGSKNRISKEILPIITKYLTEDRCYVEPFCGGCGMLDKVKHGKKIGSDINNYLIAMWRFLQQGFDFPKTITKKMYTMFRDKYNDMRMNNEKRYGNSLDEAVVGWYGFMGSFNGRFFDGGYSGHDVNGRDYIGEQIRNTIRQVELIKDVLFECGSYDEINIPENSVIYCDIPYKDTKQYSTSKNFDHEKFWEWCRRKTGEGNDVLVSEYQAPDDFVCIWEKRVTNSMNTKNTYKPVERLFVHSSIAWKYMEEENNDGINDGTEEVALF